MIIDGKSSDFELAGGGFSAAITELRLAGREYAIPDAALPFLRHGLDLSFFDVAALPGADATAADHLRRGDAATATVTMRARSATSELTFTAAKPTQPLVSAVQLDVTDGKGDSSGFVFVGGAGIPEWFSPTTRRLARGRLAEFVRGGGTSASSPIVAGIYGLAGNATTVRPGYEQAHASAQFDVTKGNNDWFFGQNGAVCGYDYLCVAKKDYDAPTGLGTPDGIGAF